MMTKEISYRLDYREDGKPCSKNIRISFVSNSIRRDFFKIQSDIEEGRRLSALYSMRMSEFERLTAEKKDTAEVLGHFVDLKNQLEAILGEDGANSFEKRRIALCRKVLIKNGFSETDRFISPEFWDESVDIETINEFLDVAINKDLDKAKKK